MLHFKLPAAQSVHIPTGEALGFTPFRSPRACCHIRPQKYNGLQDSPRASCSCGEGGDGREKPKRQLHTCWEGRWTRRPEISSSGEDELWVGTTRFGGVVFSGGGFDTRDSLLPSSPLRGCWKFGLRFLSSGLLPVGGHYRLVRSLRNPPRKVLGCGLEGGVVVALTTRPLGRRSSTPYPDPGARQWDWPFGLSELQVLLRRRSFGCARALALQEPPSLPSTLHRSDSSLRCFPRNYRN